MSHPVEAIAVESKAVETVVTPSASVKDSGRVRYGSGALMFADVKDSGRVRYGSGALMFTNVKDAGRVRYGSGAMQF